MKQHFRVFLAPSATQLECELNEWARTLSPRCRIRRTQLAANAGEVVALVNYEEDDAAVDSER
jgi:hypothetical protein